MISGMAHTRYNTGSKQTISPDSDSEQTSGNEWALIHDRIRQLESRLATLTEMVQRLIPQQPAAPAASVMPVPLLTLRPSWNSLELEVYQRNLTANYARNLEILHQQEEQRRIQLFLQGLRPELRHHLGSYQFTTLNDYIQRCLFVEADLVRASVRRSAALRESRRKRSRTEDEPATARTVSIQPGILSCLFCGESHYAYACPQRHRRCYGSGQLGHLRNECSQRPLSGTSLVSTSTVPGQQSDWAPDTATTRRTSFRHQPEQWDAPESSAGGD